MEVLNVQDHRFVIPMKTGGVKVQDLYFLTASEGEGRVRCGSHES